MTQHDTESCLNRGTRQAILRGNSQGLLDDFLDRTGSRIRDLLGGDVRKLLVMLVCAILSELRDT